jgi:hypothetical protein
MLEDDGMFGNPLWVDRQHQRNENRRDKWEEENLLDLVEALPYSVIPNERDGQAVIDHLIETGWTPPWENSGSQIY